MKDDIRDQRALGRPWGASVTLLTLLMALLGIGLLPVQSEANVERDGCKVLPSAVTDCDTMRF